MAEENNATSFTYQSRKYWGPELRNWMQINTNDKDEFWRFVQNDQTGPEETTASKPVATTFKAGQRRVVVNQQTCQHPDIVTKVSQSEKNPGRSYRSCKVCNAFLGWVNQTKAGKADDELLEEEPFDVEPETPF